MERIIYLYSGRADSLSRRIEEDFTELVGPIHPKVFFSPLTEGLLGLYESSRGCIFISDGLIRQPYDTVRQVAIHELAHWRNHVETGSLEHDASFRRWCRALGCDEDHSKARIAVIHRSGVIDKVRKLKSLSSSPFEAESQAAIIERPDIVLIESTSRLFQEGQEPLVLTAGRLSYWMDEERMEVEELHFTQNSDDGQVDITGSADHARIDTASSIMELSGSVDLSSRSAGLSISGDQLIFDTPEQTIDAPGEVHVSFDGGSLRAIGLSADLDSMHMDLGQIIDGEVVGD